MLRCFMFLGCYLLLISRVLLAQPIYSSEDRFHPVVGEYGMVATQQALATDVGIAILKQGGNAIDAAVAVGFSLAVTLPRAGNLGGGGFMLLRLPSNEVLALDYREKAPLKASQDMFLDTDGNVDMARIRYSPLAAGVPGTVLGLITALESYGTMSLQAVLAPAIRLAREGFIVDYDLASSLIKASDRLGQSSASKQVFFNSDGSVLKQGQRLFQPDLAWSLTELSRKGEKAFYDGSISNKIVRFMEQEGGVISHADLKAYRPVWRTPVTGEYRGYTIHAMPPPSSGGVHLIQLLNILEGYSLDEWGHNSAQTIHVMAEAMKRAYADRSVYLGDPDFVDVPVKGLISKSYAKTIREHLSLEKVTPSDAISSGSLSLLTEGPETTHFTISDRWGNVVSNTYTLNFSYGSKLMVPGTGILLNNEMDDFVAKPGVANAYGLVGSSYNAIEPEKRMLSSMAPTIVTQEGRFVLATGSPGGSRIITTVLQVLLNVIDHGYNIAEASILPRIHHQWQPDILWLEKGIGVDTRSLLLERGYICRNSYASGSVQSILRRDGVYYGASDTRKTGALTVGLHQP